MNKALLLAFSIIFVSCNAIKLDYDYITSSNQEIKSSLSKIDKKNWHNLDIEKDSVPGTSVERAYNELLNDLKGKKVIVAVIDTGLDIDHISLSENIWINKDEKVNGKDDDNNGYIDDIHGWNYLGSSYNETRDMTRILRDNKINNRKYNLVEEEIQKEIKNSKEQLNILNYYIQILDESKELLSDYLDNDNFSIQDVNSIETVDPKLNRAKNIYKDFDFYGYTKEYLNEGIDQYNDFINYHFNVEFNGRTTNDDIYDINDRNYGDNNINNTKESESHSTHVSGIISGNRKIEDGNKGINNLAEIMVLRAVPNGDEYDKDVALAIRYAVDNGAKIINGSFGKYFSSNPEWVIDAIRYASENDVLFIAGAGNESKDLDSLSNDNYPNDQYFNKDEFSETFIKVGASSINLDENFTAYFSNYGKINVDIFAPGVDIYSSMPNNKYKFQDGTSMASPVVAGIASLIMSYFPRLSAKKVKEIILESGIDIDLEIGNLGDKKNFNEYSKSGKLINAYNALILASKSRRK
ncbi:MAG: S8 family serine peptidase [Candidatus Marisimplicoccus sp.]|jgi:cell wall-associated protease|tara:strand:+ start:397 stop:1968 length:1572 start_codon:yes stop_codon:yes gene_type:complete